MANPIIQILIVLGTVICGFEVDSAATPNLPSNMFSCKNDVKGTALNLEAMTGYWYEVARAPKEDVLKCLNVSVPANASTELELDLEYIATYDKNHHAVRESVSFPWNSQTQNSVFVLKYNSPYMDILVTYKVVFAIPNQIAVLCGYSNISPMPLLKVMTREKIINPTLKKLIETSLKRYGVLDYLTWTEQSPDKCNAAMRPVGGLFTIAIFALGITWNLFRW